MDKHPTGGGGGGGGGEQYSLSPHVMGGRINFQVQLS